MRNSPRRSVDVLLLRTVKCAEDSRLNKILYHYEKIGIRVGVSCISRGMPCSRTESAFVSHKTLKISWPNLDSISSRLVRRVTLRFQLLRFVMHVKPWKPQVIHGCDLDGYLVGKLAFPGKKIIFEVYDPWTTMTNSKRAAHLESKAFMKCDVLVMPALNSRVKVDRDYQSALSNALDIGLANKLLRVSKLHDVVSLLIEQEIPYILTGGILGAEVGSDVLAEAISLTKSGLHLVIASDNLESFGLNHRDIPDNIHFIGKQSWADWLALVKNASALWVYYDQRIKHFESHISPNKYWEAALFEIPIIVNSIDQFCDRIPHESRYFEIDISSKFQLEATFNDIASLSRASQSSVSVPAWQKLESERTELVKQFLLWVGVKP